MKRSVFALAVALMTAGSAEAGALIGVNMNAGNGSPVNWNSYTLGDVGTTKSNLIAEDGSDALLQSKAEFAITQDQRNTVRGHVRLQPWRRLWVAMGASYGSGLPVELAESASIANLEQHYGSRILARVNFDRGRVR